MKKFLFPFALAGIMLISACGSDDHEGSANNPAFDRTAMLANMVDQHILSQYAEMNSQMAALAIAAQAFADAPDAQTLSAAQAAWTAAFGQWQYCRSFTIGPGDGTIDIAREIGTFPINADGVETLISEMDTAFNSFQPNTRGLLAVEYLLYANDPIAEMNSNANRPLFLMALVRNIAGKISAVHSGWESQGSSFASDNGTDAGSSTTQMFNAFNQSFETVKNFKVGLPAGKRPGQTESAPEQVEAYYSGQSVDFIRTHLKAVEAIWTGDTDAGEGIGFEEYIQSVSGGENLVNSTLDSWGQILQTVDNLPSQPLAQTIRDDPNAVNELHEQLTDHTRFFKSDMSSLLGLTITYDSGDGD